MTSVRRSRTNVTRWFLSHIRGGDSSSRQVLEAGRIYITSSPHRSLTPQSCSQRAIHIACKRPSQTSAPRRSEVISRRGAGVAGGRRRGERGFGADVGVMSGRRLRCVMGPHVRTRSGGSAEKVLPQCSLQAQRGPPPGGYHVALTLGWLGTTGAIGEPPPCGAAIGRGARVQGAGEAGWPRARTLADPIAMAHGCQPQLSSVHGSQCLSSLRAPPPSPPT